MTKFDPTRVKEIIDELRASTYGHGAFSELESYPPSARDLEIADLIESLVKDTNDVYPPNV